MSSFVTDSHHFTMRGTFYPKGHIFAMFPNEAGAHDAAHKVAAVAHVGAVTVVTAQEIGLTFGKRAEEVGGLPSVGREDQFMLRFVELARDNEAGLLIEVAHGDVQAISQLLQDGGAWLAYHYRALVIDELIEANPGAEAAAAGKL